MDIRKLQRAIVDGLEDVKGQNIVVFNTEHLSSLFERVIIASGTSNRQTKSLAGSVREAVKKAGFPIPRLEGEDNGEWIIVDCGAAVAHVMQPAIRDYYHLEEIWGDKPIRLKVDGVARKLVKASEDASETAEPASKKAGAKKTAAKKTAKDTAKETAKETANKPVATKSTAAKPPARKVAAKTAAGRSSAAVKKAAPTPAREPQSSSRSSSRSSSAPAGKAPAPARAPAAKKAVTRVTGVKSAGGASTASRRPAAKKPPARPAKTVVVKPAPRKSGGRA